jgi:hypothetical protein
MGEGVVRIDVRSRDWQRFAAKHGIEYEVPVPRAPYAGMTKTLIPMHAVDEFNSMARSSWP